MSNIGGNHDILIVDDEEDICRLIADILKDEGYEPRYVKDSLSALEELADRQPSLLLLDIWLEGSQLDGLGILEIVSKKYPNIPVLMISGHGNIETAVNSIIMGAYDFIEKPFKEERLVLACQKAIENAELKRTNQILQSKIIPEDEFIGNSAVINALMGIVEKYAATKSRVFLTGETGSGKKHMARVFHNNSDLKDRPLIIFSPASYKPEQLEEVIFGKGIDGEGSFSSAMPKESIFEAAKGGTLVIDEVTNLPLEIQGKMLKALATNKYKRMGSEKEYPINCRIISTTSRDMDAEVAEGRFKGDFYHRLNVVPVAMPPIRERRDDIPLLCNYFLEKYAEISGKAAKTLSEEALSVIQSYEWPGNIRQLRNVVEWITIMSPKTDNEIIEVSSLANDIFSSVPNIPGSDQIENNVDIMSMPLRDARELFEKQYLLAQVNRFGGNISKTSAFIGMERSALHRKLKSLNVHDVRKKPAADQEDAADENADEEKLANVG